MPSPLILLWSSIKSPRTLYFLFISLHFHLHLLPRQDLDRWPKAPIANLPTSFSSYSMAKSWSWLSIKSPPQHHKQHVSSLLPIFFSPWPIANTRSWSFAMTPNHYPPLHFSISVNVVISVGVLKRTCWPFASTTFSHNSSMYFFFGFSSFKFKFLNFVWFI